MSRVQLRPQGITVLPLDKQRLSFEASPPPPLWHTISNGAIQADSKLQIVTAPGTVSGSSGNALYSGGGRLEFTINDNQKPTSSGSLIYIISNSSGSLKFEVQITATQIIVKNESAVTLFSTPYTPTTGDTFVIYVGDFFRLSKAGIQLFERNGTPPIAFPCTYTASLTTPVGGASPAIAPPALFGDWRIAPNAPVAFSLSSGTGSIIAISATLVEYTGSTIPGDHPLTAWLAQAQDSNQIQRAQSLLVTPPLILLGDSQITLKPGQKIRPKTNYDKAQTLGLVTLAIVSGGGALSQGEFTAPSSPGVTVLRATSTATNQIADLTITVPAVITPEIDAVGQGDVVDWLSNLTLPAWAASAGQINAGTGLWTAPQLPIASARITATVGGVVATRDVEILEKFPFTDFSAPMAWDRKKTVLVATAEDRSRTSRVKDKDGKPFEAHEIRFENKDVGEIPLFDDFWDRHHPGKRFVLENKLRKVSKVGYFDSDLRYEAAGDCSVNVIFRFVEG